MPSYKIILVGKSGVGKSSIVFRACFDRFTKHIDATIGASYHKCTYNVTKKPESKMELPESDIVNLEIWDTAGQERYRSIVPLYLRNCHAVLFVFDLSDKNSFNELVDYWVDYIRDKTTKPYISYIIGNKNDLNCTADIDLSKVKSLGKYFETSAFNGSGVTKVFNTLAYDLYNNELINNSIDTIDELKNVLNKNHGEEKSKLCCY